MRVFTVVTRDASTATPFAIIPAAAKHLAFIHEVHDGNRSFRREPRGGTPHVAVQHEVARHANPPAAKGLRKTRKFSAIDVHIRGKNACGLRFPLCLPGRKTVFSICTHSSRHELSGATSVAQASA